MRAEEIYRILLKLYPRPFRDRFAECLVQTFADLERERRAGGESLLWFHSWIFLDTTASILKENAAMLGINTRQLQTAAAASLALLIFPLFLTLTNPTSRLRGGEGGGFDWMPASFLVMGLLLFLVAIAIQVAAIHIARPAARGAVIIAIVGLFGLIWAELAVDAVSQAVAFLA